MLILAKNAEIMLLPFTLSLVNTPTKNDATNKKMQTLLPYLQQETLLEHNSL